MESNENQAQAQPVAENSGKVDNLVGILSYITLIGWIIALIMNNDKNGETKSFGAYHLRQSIGLMLVGLVVGIGLGILSTILLFIAGFFGLFFTIIYPVFYIGMLVLLIMGIINAANSEKKPLPLVGGFIEKTLKKAFE